MPNKVLVTGVTGFVGSHLADYILENHPEVEIYGLKRWRSPIDNIRHIEDRLKLIDGDLRDLSSMLSAVKQIKPDWIFHLAAQSFIPYSYTAPIDILTTNIIGTTNLLEAIRILSIDARILICSSPEVYGQPDERDMPTTEDCPLKPLSPYGVSKVAEDTLAHMYHQAYGLKTIISRAFAHEGPRRGKPFAVSYFAWQIAKLEKQWPPTEFPIIYVGNLDSVRTYMDIRDTTRAYWLLLEKGEPSEAYNIAGNETMSLREVLNNLLDMTMIARPHIKVDSSLLRPADVTVQIANDSKFRRLTKWEPEIPFRKTLEDTLNYWRERV